MDKLLKLILTDVSKIRLLTCNIFFDVFQLLNLEFREKNAIITKSCRRHCSLGHAINLPFILAIEIVVGLSVVDAISVIIVLSMWPDKVEYRKKVCFYFSIAEKARLLDLCTSVLSQGISICQKGQCQFCSMYCTTICSVQL